MALAASDFSSIIPYLVALKDMAIAGAGAAAAWTALAVFLVICLGADGGAGGARATGRRRQAERVLGPAAAHARRSTARTIIAVVCFVIAAYLAVKGVRGL